MPRTINTPKDEYRCCNPACSKAVIRTRSKIEPSGHVFCSHTCSASFTNRVRASRKLPRNKCANPSCSNLVEGLDCLCCSRRCRYTCGYLKRGYTERGIVKVLQEFFKTTGRVPLKREMDRYYRPARRLFGTWNNAIEAANLIPNPVLFANHIVARDGHKSDSLVERILDDWLSRRGIQHEVHIRYPWGGLMSADFKIGDYWIELFGLKGELARYDFLRKKKLSLVNKFKLKFIGLETRDVLNPELLSVKLAPIFYANIQATQARLAVN